MKYTFIKQTKIDLERVDTLQARYPALSLTNILDIYRSKVNRSKERHAAYKRAVEALLLQISDEEITLCELELNVAALEVADKQQNS